MSVGVEDHETTFSALLTREGRAPIIDLAAVVKPAGAGPAWYVEMTAGWLRSLVRRGRTPKTQRTYAYVARDFGRWLDGARIAAPGDLVIAQLQAWQDDLVARPLAQHTQAVHTNAIRGLLRWAAREGLGITPGLWEHVDVVRIPKSQPRALEPEDLALILARYAPPGGPLRRLRDRALFWFLCTTGSRIAAALSLQRDQVRGPLTIRQKGGSQHTLVPSATARGWLQQYLDARGRDEQPALWIWEGRRGRRPLTAELANEIWRGLSAELRIPHFTNHCLRHTSATELGELGLSDTEVANQLGWASNAMAMRYREVRQGRRVQLVNRLDDLIPSLPPDPPAKPGPRRRRRYRVIRRLA